MANHWSPSPWRSVVSPIPSITVISIFTNENDEDLQIQDGVATIGNDGVPGEEQRHISKLALYDMKNDPYEKNNVIMDIPFMLEDGVDGPGAVPIHFMSLGIRLLTPLTAVTALSTDSCKYRFVFPGE